MTGLVMSGYFFGFFVGSIIIPKLVSQVGHVRVFGALSGLASTSILIHALNDHAFLAGDAHCDRLWLFGDVYCC